MARAKAFLVAMSPASSIVSGRDRIHDLRSDSIERQGLIQGLYALVEQLDGDERVKIAVNVSGELRRVKPLVQDEVLWIVTEAMSNARKHSSATAIGVHLSQEQRRLQCSVSRQRDRF